MEWNKLQPGFFSRWKKMPIAEYPIPTLAFIAISALPIHGTYQPSIVGGRKKVLRLVTEDRQLIHPPDKRLGRSAEIARNTRFVFEYQFFEFDMVYWTLKQATDALAAIKAFQVDMTWHKQDPIHDYSLWLHIPRWAYLDRHAVKSSIVSAIAFIGASEYLDHEDTL